MPTHESSRRGGIGVALTVDHWARFKSATARAQFVNAVSKRGFLCVNESKAEDGRSEFAFILHFQRSSIVEIDAINNLTWELEELAGKHDGDYDGWETQVMKHR